MVGFLATSAILGVTTLNAQERVISGEAFLTDSLGWFFTDTQVEDMARDVERVPLLEERVAAMEELLALKDWQIERERGYREVYSDLLDEAREIGKPGFWQSIPPVVWMSVGAVGTAWVLREQD